MGSGDRTQTEDWQCHTLKPNIIIALLSNFKLVFFVIHCLILRDSLLFLIDC